MVEDIEALHRKATKPNSNRMPLQDILISNQSAPPQKPSASEVSQQQNDGKTDMKEPVHHKDASASLRWGKSRNRSLKKKVMYRRGSLENRQQ
jgi:hypothetical protein